MSHSPAPPPHQTTTSSSLQRSTSAVNSTPHNTQPAPQYLVRFDIDSKTLILLLQSLRFKSSNTSNPANRSDATDGTSSRAINTSASLSNEWISLEFKTNGVILSLPSSASHTGFHAKAIMKQELFHIYSHPNETTYQFQVKMGVLMDCIYLCSSSVQAKHQSDTMISVRYPGRENSLVISSFASMSTNCVVRTKHGDVAAPSRGLGEPRRHASEFHASDVVARLEVDAQVLREALREILFWQQGVILEIQPDKFMLRTKTNDVTAVEVSIENNAKAFFQYRCQSPGTKDEYNWEHMFKCLQPLSASKTINKVQLTTNAERMLRFRYFPTGDSERNATVEYLLLPSSYDMDDDDSMRDEDGSDGDL